MSKIDEAILNIDKLSKQDLTHMIALCDKSVKQTEEKIKNANITLLKLKLANKRDDLKHKRQIFVSKFHQV